MQLEVKGLKFWKGKPQSHGLTLFYFLYPTGYLLKASRLSICGWGTEELAGYLEAT